MYTWYMLYDNLGQHVDNGPFDRWWKLRSTYYDIILRHKHKKGGLGPGQVGIFDHISYCFMDNHQNKDFYKQHGHEMSGCIIRVVRANPQWPLHLQRVPGAIKKHLWLNRNLKVSRKNSHHLYLLADTTKWLKSGSFPSQRPRHAPNNVLSRLYLTCICHKNSVLFKISGVLFKRILNLVGFGIYQKYKSHSPADSQLPMSQRKTWLVSKMWTHCDTVAASIWPFMTTNTVSAHLRQNSDHTPSLFIQLTTFRLSNVYKTKNIWEKSRLTAVRAVRIYLPIQIQLQLHPDVSDSHDKFPNANVQFYPNSIVACCFCPHSGLRWSLGSPWSISC